MYAEIIVNAPVEGTFHYHIPAALAGRLRPGHLVEISFGQQRAQGIILRLDTHSPVDTTKPVLALIDREPVVMQAQLQLAAWMSEYYLTPLAQCVRLFVPPGLAKRGDVLITPIVDLDKVAAANDTQVRLLKLLARRGPLRGRQIDHSMPRRNWQSALHQLVERGVLAREPILDPPSVSPKMVRVAELAFPPQRVEELIIQCLDLDGQPPKRRARLERRAAILRLLARERQVIDISQVYVLVPGSNPTDLRALAEDDLIVLRPQEVWRDPLEGMAFVPDVPPRLTTDQAAAWETICKAIDQQSPSQPILVHGVTGSGKTELYLRAVEHILAQGRSAIVLVPEIALTPQTVRRFGARFPGRMGLIHSKLSPGERYDTWRRARSGQYDVVIGPRSALFTPMRKLGLIVIDEVHDDSYKQSLPVVPPYYPAVDIAIQMGRQQSALVLMGAPRQV
jgi:primosomal protein N' (replication factor Y)